MGFTSTDYFGFLGGPKKWDSKENRLSCKPQLPPDFNPLAWIFSQYTVENKNAAIEYTSAVVSNKDTFCKSGCFQFFARI